MRSPITAAHRSPVRLAAAAFVGALWFCLAPPALAQEPAEPGAATPAEAGEAGTAEAENPPSQAPADSDATDRAEDRYRASRELEEADRSRSPRRPNFTVPQASPDGFDRLPPESRQHLRDQLKQVIIANGEWTPADAGKQYPYVPSEGAMAEPALKQAEREAWGGMVADYHAREAEAHAARQAAADGGADAAGEGEAGEGEAGQDGAASSAAAAAAQAADSLSAQDLARQAEDEEMISQGVTQSALDYLRGGATGASPPTPANPEAAGSTQAAAAEAPPPRADAAGDAGERRALHGLILIEDLPNAQGVDAVAASPPEEEESEQDRGQRRP